MNMSTEIGKGSVFSIELPIAQDQDVRPKQSLPAQRAPIDAGIAGKHVLLVEDDPAVRAATRMLLKVEGYRITAVASVDEARKVLQTNRDIEVIVTDYHLAHGDTGIQVIAAARELLDPAIKAVLVTGDTSSAVQALNSDTNLRIASKPVKADELLTLLKSLLVA